VSEFVLESAMARAEETLLWGVGLAVAENTSSVTPG
jgi:uncharacterized protein (DUF1778 family)